MRNCSQSASQTFCHMLGFDSRQLQTAPARCGQQAISRNRIHNKLEPAYSNALRLGTSHQEDGVPRMPIWRCTRPRNACISVSAAALSRGEMTRNLTVLPGRCILQQRHRFMLTTPTLVGIARKQRCAPSDGAGEFSAESRTQQCGRCVPRGGGASWGSTFRAAASGRRWWTRWWAA